MKRVPPMLLGRRRKLNVISICAISTLLLVSTMSFGQASSEDLTIPFFNKRLRSGKSILQRNANKEPNYDQDHFAIKKMPNANNEITSDTETQEDETISEVPTKALQDLIAKVKRSLCKSIGAGQVSFWVKSDTEAKILGIGTSSGSGLQISVLCAEEVSVGGKK